ncbi:MAG TPA: hypothetical protein VF530_01175, partial [Planctomycetota bacterium]
MFQGFLARLARGESLTLEDVLKAHPELESDLRELQRQRVLDPLGPEAADEQGSVHERIRRHLCEESPEVSLSSGTEMDESAPSHQLLDRLAGRESFGRYRVMGEVAKGAMGI